MGSEFHWIESIRLVRELMSEEGSEDGERQDVMNRTVELNLGIIVFIVRMIVLKIIYIRLNVRQFVRLASPGIGKTIGRKYLTNKSELKIFILTEQLDSSNTAQNFKQQ